MAGLVLMTMAMVVITGSLHPQTFYISKTIHVCHDLILSLPSHDEEDRDHQTEAQTPGRPSELCHHVGRRS